ncbi:MAG TPA: Ig-like domain-containing protein [Gemmatimonadales bacterium]|nr:Ig-like domain-containing protein [Gemmatimonadales bacterium]
MSLAGPPPGGVAGVVDLTATATDNVAVTAVRFLVNGSLYAELTTPPWILHWNSDGFDVGNYAWRAVALDAAGNADTSASLSYSHGLYTSALKVVVVTTGSQPDADGYTFYLNTLSYPLASNDSIRFAPMPSGNQQLRLEGIAANCTLAGDNPRTVSLTLNTETRAVLSVTCTTVTGPLQVVVHTTGRNLDADGYTVAIDGGTAVPVGVNDSITFPGVTQGAHSIAAAGAASNCAFTSQVPVTIGYPATTRIVVEARCLGSLAGRVLFGEDKPSLPGGGAFLWSANPDGSGREQITLDPAEFYGFPSVAPDGQSIRYVGTNGAEMRSMDWDGRNPHRMPLDPLLVPVEPNWSSTGRLVFVAGGNSGGGGHVWVADTNGSAAVDLSGSSTSDDQTPCWSPDGSQIAYSKDGKLAIMQADGTNPHEIAAPGIAGSQCSWSPDGTRLAFANGDLFTVRTDGTELTPVTSYAGAARASRPRWSPDGSALLFQYSTIGPTGPSGPQVHRIQADGSGEIDVSQSGLNAYFPSWGP